MEYAVAYSTLAMTVSLAVLRPRIGLRVLRFSPGKAAVLGVLVLLAFGLLGSADLAEAVRLQWRPLVTLASIMLMTGLVIEVGAFDRLAAALEVRARGRSAVGTFTLVFVLSVLTAALLNNDAEAEAGWLQALCGAFHAGNDVGMAASKILVHEDPGRIDKAGHLIYLDGQNRGRGFVRGQWRDGVMYARLRRDPPPAQGIEQA